MTPADPTGPAGPTGHGRFVVVPAAYVFLLRPVSDDPADGEEVLLQLRSGTGFMDDHWAAGAAGHVERGETAYDAAAREASEELGLTDVELRYELTMQRTGISGEPIDERVDFFFTARRWTGEPRIVEPHRSADLRWCRLDALDDLPGPVVPHERRALAALGGPDTYLTHGFPGTGSTTEREGASA